MLHVERNIDYKCEMLHVERQKFKYMVISGTIVDVLRRKMFKGRLHVINGKISDIQSADIVNPVYILPGLIDSHVHIESSMVTPARFAQNAVKHGVISAISDPHEIANVCGIEGIKFMLENAKQVPFKFWFGAPSCVPSTPFENSGAELDAKQIGELFDQYGLKYLAEMMNFPGVVNQNHDVVAKLKEAIDRNLPIDGHAPGLTGEPLVQYINMGISTDHECTSLAEAEEKIKCGMKIIIREGSAAKNFDELYPLIDIYPDQVMLCTDDFHPENFSKSYLNRLIKIGQEKGLDFWNLMQAVTINPIAHYKIDVGLVQVGDNADFIVVDNPKKFNVLQTWIDGKLVFDGINTFDYSGTNLFINNFNAKPISPNSLAVKAKSGALNVIQAIDGDLYTNCIKVLPKIHNDECLPDIENDILKLVVVNRYDENPTPKVAFVNGFDLKKGAIASSIAHDSHNIIAVGTNDHDIANAINAVIENRGGISAASENQVYTLGLPIAGLLTDENVETVSQKYMELDKFVKEYGTNLSAPFMTLAFMSLLVIPKIKLGDRGLFDVTKFEFIDLFSV